MAKNGVHSSLGSIDEIREVFQRYDKNGDGKISSDELRDVIGALEPAAAENEVSLMMKELDTDRDGFINLEEFVAYFAGGGDDGEKDLKAAFDLYDLDGNGLISAKELHAVMKNLGEKCSVRDCSKMIGQVDADGDGYVNFEEFKKMMNGGGK